MVSSQSEPTVEEVLAFEDLPPGEMASRRAVVRWSDGAEGEALGYADEVLVCEGDLIGKTQGLAVAALPAGSRLASVVSLA